MSRHVIRDTRPREIPAGLSWNEKDGRLETASGRPILMNRWTEARQKLGSDPASLTPVDIAVIEAWDGHQAADEAFEKRARALAGTVLTREQRAKARLEARQERRAERERATAQASAGGQAGSFDKAAYDQKVADYKRALNELPALDLSATVYDRKLYQQAAHRYLSDPTLLTEDDVKQLAVVDPDRADRARLLQRGVEDPRYSIDVPLSVGQFVELREHDAAIIETYKHQIREAHKRITALEAKLEGLTDQRFKAFERRLEQVEQRPGLAYKGVWPGDTTYQKGDVVSRSGGMWHCNQTTHEPPGNGHAAWTLCVKSGERGPQGPRGNPGEDMR
jgi:hypothetical protein